MTHLARSSMIYHKSACLLRSSVPTSIQKFFGALPPSKKVRFYTVEPVNVLHFLAASKPPNLGRLKLPWKPWSPEIDSALLSCIKVQGYRGPPVTISHNPILFWPWGVDVDPVDGPQFWSYWGLADVFRLLFAQDEVLWKHESAAYKRWMGENVKPARRAKFVREGL